MHGVQWSLICIFSSSSFTSLTPSPPPFQLQSDDSDRAERGVLSALRKYSVPERVMGGREEDLLYCVRGAHAWARPTRFAVAGGRFQQPSRHSSANFGVTRSRIVLLNWALRPYDHAVIFIDGRSGRRS